MSRSTKDGEMLIPAALGSRVVEISGQTQDPIYLTSPDGYNKLANALLKSNGEAIALVHPFYPHNEEDSVRYSDETKKEYTLYLDRLYKSLENYGKLNLPVILFEENDMLTNQNATHLNINLIPRNLFVIPTIKNGSIPYDQSLSKFAHLLKTKGLKRVIAVGTYLWTGGFIGCIGELIEEFSQAGIPTTPGEAAFPRKDMHSMYRRLE